MALFEGTQLSMLVCDSLSQESKGCACPSPSTCRCPNTCASCWSGTARAAGLIGLEMTESSLMQNPAASIAELERLSDMGFRLYIDDFGTGYSSLSYLSRLPVDVITIDHGFTMPMIEDGRAASIVKSTVHLAHDLGVRVVAEGVSNARIWEALYALGCDGSQGFHVAAPMPAASLLDWARASPYHPQSGHACA